MNSAKTIFSTVLCAFIFSPLASAKVIHLEAEAKKSSVQDALSTVLKNENVVLKFYATWCGPCRRMDPIVEGLSEEFDGEVTFVAINIDRLSSVSSEYGVQSIPAFRYIKNGSVVAKSLGAMSKKEMRKKVVDAFNL